MKKYIYIITFLFTFNLHSEVFDGYTLFTAMEADLDTIKTYLINNDYEIINSWIHEYGAASMPYLLPDSTIIYPYRVPNPSMETGGVGGGIEKQSWNGEILWDYQFANLTYQHHHDIDPLPNGNILIIVWERKSAEEATEMGRLIIESPLNEVWSFALLELNPETGEIEWEWHIWDHLVQDVNPNYPGYGLISDHPELFNINCGEIGGAIGGPQNPNADWMHINAVDYNPILDQIAISSRSQNEIFIIDHSTTTEEAAGHTGGNSGKGGDFLYRWGNPINYGREDTSYQTLSAPHGVDWIHQGYPGEGNLLIFNNMHINNPPQSAILEIVLPVDSDGNYILDNNKPYEPAIPEWLFVGGVDILSSPIQSGAFRLPNGNTFATQCMGGRMIEIDTNGNVLWEYQPTPGGWINRAQKYSINYLINSITGDLNDDGGVNVLDVVILANLVLSQYNFDENADLNGDGGLNVLDIVQLVNIILNS